MELYHQTKVTLEKVHKECELIFEQGLRKKEVLLVFASVSYVFDIPRYTGFWGGLRKPPKEAEINRFCNQLS